MTMGEMALLAAARFGSQCDLKVIEMKNWKRSMSFEDTGLEFVPPSPNIPIVESCYPYVGTVMLEGVFVSEGRGTTRPFEIIGHPKLDAFSFVDELHQGMKEHGIGGCVLRPAVFVPTFDKFAGQRCGGFQIHVADRKTFRPWIFTSWIMREIFRKLDRPAEFWRPPPYEYEYKLMPIDILAGSETVRAWVESEAPLSELREQESRSVREFEATRQGHLRYS
jgi:uncharacterized protein YbbC (DUF1343 family)